MLRRLGQWVRRLLGSAPAAESPPTSSSYPAPERAIPAAAIPEPSKEKRGKAPAVHAATASEPEADDFLQIRGYRPGAPTDLVIGFDFGTSCSKVVIQSPYTLGGRAVAMPFGLLGHPKCEYFLPSRLWIAADGVLSLSKPSGAADLITDLKVPLLEGPDTRSTALAAAYIALALRSVRSHFFRVEAANHPKQPLRWSFNLGIPSAGYDDRAVRNRFGTVARLGWALSLQDAPLTVASAQAAFAALAHAQPTGVDIAVIPEVAAEVVVYAQSRQRQEDLHLIIDVGATTLDLCAFNLYRQDGSDRYGLLTADVTRLGLVELHLQRMAATGKFAPFDRLPDDLIEPMPERPDGFPAELSGKLAGCDNYYRQECARRLLGAVFDVKKQRYPKSPRWSSGLPVFVCGGGASAAIVAQVVNDAERYAKKHLSAFPGFLRWGLPPAPLHPPTVPFERLAVAFGLSFPEPRIGEVQAPREIPSIEESPRPSTWQDRFIDKDQV